MKQTALIAEHKKANAKLVDFHGWELPLHYGSQINEHNAVRNDCGMFDVSHMTVVDLLGAGGRQFLRHLLANDVDKLSYPGQALYTCMLNQHGGILDDLIVYFINADNYRLVLNSATREKDIAWLKTQVSGFSVGLQVHTDLSLIAVQGPNAITKVTKIVTPRQLDAISTLKPFVAFNDADGFFARTGYTGEDGLEIIMKNEQIETLWQTLLTEGVAPCGLGARDSLRIEAGMMLYGQDMDESTTPLETGLGWTLKFQPEDRDFIGRGALLAQIQLGIKSKMVGLILEDKGILRQGQKVINKDGAEGIVTSGGFSPTLNKSIGFARVPVKTEKECVIEIRNKKMVVKVTKPRFVRHGKIITE